MLGQGPAWGLKRRHERVVGQELGQSLARGQKQRQGRVVGQELGQSLAWGLKRRHRRVVGQELGQRLKQRLGLRGELGFGCPRVDSMKVEKKSVTEFPSDDGLVSEGVRLDSLSHPRQLQLFLQSNNKMTKGTGA